MAMETVLLGQTGLRISRVGFGVLPIGPNQLALPLEEGAAVLRYGLEQGINFIDTAQYYRTYPYIRKALSSFSGADPIICSKSLSVGKQEMLSAIEEARQALNRDVIDIFLLHEVRSGQLSQREGALEALVDAKARGLIRAIGLSTHHVDIVNAASQAEDLDVIFPLVNYKGLGIRQGEQFASAEDMMTAIRLCFQKGKGVFSMKAFGGGSLTATYQKALRYVFSQVEIQSVMIGFGNTSEIDDVLSFLHGTMAPDYNPDVSHKKIHISQADCEGCGACKTACPASAIFYNRRGLAQVDQEKCLTCGYCSPVCPVRAIIMY